MNPAGVVIGAGAKVEVSGSFIVTTANHIKLADGGRYDASDPANDILTTAPPSAFGFLGPTPQPIDLRGPGGQDPGPTLTMLAEGRTIALIGGNIEIINRSLIAPAGQVVVASVRSEGEVLFDPDVLNAKLDTASFQELGHVTIDDLSLIDVSGDAGGKFVIQAASVILKNNTFVFADTFGSGNGLGIDISARDSIELRDGALLEVATFSDGDAGPVHFSAQSIHLLGQTVGTAITTFTGGGGKAGDIILEANSIFLEQAAQIGAASGGSGDCGEIEMHAESLRLTGDGAQVTVDTFSDGDGGSINVHASSLQVGDGASITAQTLGPAKGGDIRVNAGTVDIHDGARISAATENAGAGGNVEIHADTITLDEGSSALTGITVSSLGDGDAGQIVIGKSESGNLDLHIGPDTLISAQTFGAGAGGNIDIDATTITIAGTPGISLETGIQARTSGSGTGGGINITTESLHLAQVGDISVAASGSGAGGNIEIDAGEVIIQHSSTISANTEGFGLGGNIHITADRIQLDGAEGVAQITAGNPNGVGGAAAGNITLDVGSLELLNGGSVTVSTIGPSNGGAITVNADNISLRNGGSIQSSTVGGGIAGSIVLHAEEDIILRASSSVSVSAAGSDGGGITATANDQFRIESGSSITSAAFQDGGNITLKAGTIFYGIDSLISAEAQNGDGGNITIDPPFVALGNCDVIARALNGQGGDIFVIANGFLGSLSQFDASGAEPGLITIESPDLDLSGSLVVLGVSLLEESTQLRPACAVKLPIGTSSFIVVGRGGLPAAPDRLSPSFDW